jgi:hypothetical protein
MSEYQETDKAMRVMAVVGGIISIVEAIMILIGSGLMPWEFGIPGGVLGLILAIVAIFLGIKPIHYTPFLLGVIGVVLIVFAVLIGGIIVLLAAFFGLIS